MGKSEGNAHLAGMMISVLLFRFKFL